MAAALAGVADEAEETAGAKAHAQALNRPGRRCRRILIEIFWQKKKDAAAHRRAAGATRLAPDPPAPGARFYDAPPDCAASCASRLLYGRFGMHIAEARIAFYVTCRTDNRHPTADCAQDTHARHPYNSDYAFAANQ
ncbi:hypothetical protein BN2475_400072 [Paraburkholderia ribeironis]|uniref:Uncharacterized protein n=1 Tax=Paraburkholderia ribeironis TaxID=1247936 RepID=A0A1N7S6L7_9BURK|nr:hypothetical protein [Paraburkholderia ribeironis]SIT43074.1 hypothetical protein BN2475_400072 [Paraburkholderia ribeironis]